MHSARGFLASQHCLQTHGTDSTFAMQLNAIQEVINGNVDPRTFQILQEFVDAFFKYETVQRDALQQRQIPVFQGQVAKHALGGFHAWQHQVKTALDQCRSRASRRFGSRATQKIEDALMKYTEAMKDLKIASQQAMQHGQSNVSGIGHEYDRVLETNKMVFGILGIHTLNYGEDKDGDEHDQGVHLIFKPESLYHPDVFLTPMAATFYNSGHGDKERPWWKVGRPRDPFDAMVWEKLHASSPLFFETLATEFLARVAHKNSIDLSKAKFQDMKKYMKATNAHLSVECHFPYVTPLAWVEKVVISEHTFSKLSEADQATAKELFRSNLEIAPGTASQEMQWQLATAPLLRPLPPPAFAWTVLSTRHQEVVVPGVLQQKGRSRIFFRASRPNFSVNLSHSHRKDGLAIQVDGQKCFVSFVKGRKDPVLFNHGVGADSRSVMYCLDLDYQKKEILFKHAGESHMLNGRTVELSRVNPMPKVLSFTVPSGHMAFTDVRILWGQGDEHLFEHERPWIPQQKTVVPDRSDKKVSMAFEADQFGWVTRAYRFVTGKSRAEIPACPDGIRCKIAYHVKNRSEHQQQHMVEKRHICLYGHSCKDHKECRDHDKQFTHIEKEICKDGDQCQKLCDPYHRAEYHHPGFWDLLLPCRDGVDCKKQHDDLHGQKYHHEQLEYAVDENGLQLQELVSQTSGLFCVFLWPS